MAGKAKPSESLSLNSIKIRSVLCTQFCTHCKWSRNSLILLTEWKKKNRSFSLLIFLGVFFVVQRPPSNSQVIHLLANHFLLIFSVPIIVHNFFEAFLQIMVSSVVNWKIPFQALEFSLINKGMCQRQTLFAILLKWSQNFVYRTQMTYNKRPLCFQLREKTAFCPFVLRHLCPVHD